MNLAEEIERAKERELNANEQALAACFPQPAPLSHEAQRCLLPFVHWCDSQRVRALPAKPTSVAAFVHWQQDQGVPRQRICEILSAIEGLHNAAALANPVVTPVVSATQGTTVEPPRSWTKEEKEEFKSLPLHAQETVARREQERERELRRMHNELAALKKTATDGADTKSVVESCAKGAEEKETANG